MGTVARAILTHLRPLVGLKLALARRAADMRNFHFGPVRAVQGGTVGAYALHVQCPWRLEGPAGLLTGSGDLWEPAEANAEIDWETWHYDKDENLQDRRLSALLGGYDPTTRSLVNRTEEFVVEQVLADDYGGVTIRLSGGCRLVLFPAGSRGEDWRLFRPGTDEPLFVIAGGRVERQE